MKDTPKITVRELLKSEDGFDSYLSTLISMLVIFMMIALVLNVFSVIFAVMNLNHAADQLTKQIQLSGGVSADTDTLFTDLTGSMSSVQNCTYSVDGDTLTPTPDGVTQAFQLGAPFKVQITAEATLGGFGKVLPFEIVLSANSGGVGEIFWKS